MHIHKYMLSYMEIGTVKLVSNGTW